MNNYSPFVYFMRGLILVGFLIIFFFVKCSGSKSETQSSESTNQSLVKDSNTESTNTCNICGRVFSGNGYEEQIDGRITELSDEYQGYLCSPNCARKASQKLDDVADKYGIDANESSNSNCQRCSGRYENGFCNICGGASPERVNESNLNRASCKMCQGNGYVEDYNGVKTCPVCSGTGKESY